jgi:hypothetical protein
MHWLAAMIVSRDRRRPPERERLALFRQPLTGCGHTPTMTSQEELELALAIKEAEAQRQELRDTIKLLETPGVSVRPGSC